MKKFVIGLVGSLAMVLTMATGASAATPSVSGVGPAIPPGAPFGYYIHVVGNEFHLGTTDGGGDPSVYTGRISTGGHIRDVVLDHQEDNDWAMNDGNALDFHFATAQYEDGMRFKVTDSQRVTFRLYRNGHLISTDHIVLNGGADPTGNPFTIIF